MCENNQIMTRKDAIRVSKEKAAVLPLVEIHVLHTVAGSLLNRDFNNRQKILHYGGTLRARFTSQSVLHNIRLGMETELDVHTKYLPTLIKNILKDEAGEDSKLLATELKIVDQVFTSDKKDKATEETETKDLNEVFKTDQIIDVDQFTVRKYVEEIISAAKKVAEGSAKAKDVAKEVIKNMTTSSQDRPLSDVTALFARMSADQTYSTVYSPLLVSHAFSIDPYANDYDDYTAVDDYLLKAGIVVTDEDGCGINSGAAHMGSFDVSANTYYRYCAIAQTALFENLCVGKPFDAIDELIEKTYKMTAYFTKQFIGALPSGKETRNFARTAPDAVYIDKGPSMQGITAANMFEKAVVAAPDKSVCDIGVERLQEYMHQSVNGCFVDRALTGQYWMSDKYEAPDGVPTISYKDLEQIVRA